MISENITLTQLNKSYIYSEVDFRITRVLIFKLTVCKSLRNKISAKNPAPIPNGDKLMKAKNFPNMSPKTILNEHFLLSEKLLM